MATSVENCKSFHLVYSASPMTGFSLELAVGAWGQKTKMMGLTGRERGLTISSAVWIQHTNVTDRQTDGRTPADSKVCAYA